MAIKINSSYQTFDINSDGYDLQGGTTSRKLLLTGGDTNITGSLTITGSGANTYTFPSSTTTLVGIDTTQILTNKTINLPVINTGSLVIPNITGSTFAAGTTTQAPIKLSSGTNLATTAGGSIEYDGKVVYVTPQSTERGYLQAPQITVVQSAFTLSNATGVQAVFPAAQDTANLSATTTYMFQGFYSLINGGTSHTTATAFGGTATITNILYNAEIISAVTGSISTTVSNIVINTAASTVINAASTVSGSQIWVSGIVRINAAGTFIPQIAFSVAPGGTNQTNVNSYFAIWPLGSNTMASIGTWA